ncbi:hypothetical protein [Dyadobacter sp. CY347]|uniref:hypothetical protein n=1 Tax=Dyadobacter sp. CY347 TaxID=2909336 RepID=UPI001F462773|nr:hypothetical protein [Dyadobacter sp. CY347]MCF2489190.1 hypothetical protein [Dyadobacter sp. CY347]
MKGFRLSSRVNLCWKELIRFSPLRLLGSLLLILFMSGCKEDEIDRQQVILGKWENFYSGNGEYQPPYKSNGYWYFLPDSVLLEFDYATKQTRTSKYWIDTLLNVGIPGGDRSYYTPKFYADTMELTIENRTAINYISKWKRIE